MHIYSRHTYIWAHDHVVIVHKDTGAWTQMVTEMYCECRMEMELNNMYCWISSIPEAFTHLYPALSNHPLGLFTADCIWVKSSQTLWDPGLLEGHSGDLSLFPDVLLKMSAHWNNRQGRLATCHQGEKRGLHFQIYPLWGTFPKSYYTGLNTTKKEIHHLNVIAVKLVLSGFHVKL